MSILLQRWFTFAVVTLVLGFAGIATSMMIDVQLATASSTIGLAYVLQIFGGAAIFAHLMTESHSAEDARNESYALFLWFRMMFVIFLLAFIVLANDPILAALSETLNTIILILLVIIAFSLYFMHHRTIPKDHVGVRNGEKISAGTHYWHAWFLPQNMDVEIIPNTFTIIVPFTLPIAESSALNGTIHAEVTATLWSCPKENVFEALKKEVALDISDSIARYAKTHTLDECIHHIRSGKTNTRLIKVRKFEINMNS